MVTCSCPYPSPLEASKWLFVMDYDWGKKDDLLGEILLDPQVLLVQPGVPISFALNRKGKPGKGEVTLSATLTNQTQLQQTAISAGALTSGAQLLRVVCHQATGLKSGDMFSKNDVYVQSYFVPIGTDASKALPVPEKNMQLPVGKYVIPFEFKVRAGPPSLSMSFVIVGLVLLLLVVTVCGLDLDMVRVIR